jgi:hypothetical protein
VNSFVDPLRLRSKSKFSHENLCDFPIKAPTPGPSGSNAPSPNNVKKIEPAGSAASLMLLESEKGSRFELNRRGGERFNKRRDADQDWVISMDKIKLNEEIGAGSFGTVYKAYYFGEFYRFRLIYPQVRSPLKSSTFEMPVPI